MSKEEHVVKLNLNNGTNNLDMEGKAVEGMQFIPDGWVDWQE